MNREMIIKIGVIGTGRITDRFYEESLTVPYAKVTAIYNPRLSSGQAFAERNHCVSEVGVFDSLTAFFEMVDAVYIASPHENHYEYCKKALQRGKHVLCEKPFVLSGEEAAELFLLARDARLILMEAVKTACSPGFEKIEKLVKNGAIGTVHDVEACFTKLAPTNGREFWSNYRGSFVELGSYSLFPIVRILGTNQRDITVHTVIGVNGVDSYTKVCVDYDNAVSTAKAGIGVKSEGELIIAGSIGYIKVNSPWWMPKRIEVHHEDPNQVEVYECIYEGAGLRYEIMAFTRKIIVLLQITAKQYEEDVLNKSWDYLESIEGLTPEESIWMSCVLELFWNEKKKKELELSKHQKSDDEDDEIAIWAHRGCSMKYPENTLIAFEKAAKLPGIRGIELDVQLTNDGEVVVIHDEMVDRTTNQKGYVKDFNFDELRTLLITGAGNDEIYFPEQKIPLLREVLCLLKPYCRENDLLINIELKNSKIRYEGMEEKVVSLVKEFSLEKNVIYSSFLPESMGLIRKIDAEAQTGILGDNIHTCLSHRLLQGAQAVHPAISGLDVNIEMEKLLVEDEKRISVRAWNFEEPFFGDKRELKEYNLEKYSLLGVSDIITNVPEIYLENGN